MWNIPLIDWEGSHKLKKKQRFIEENAAIYNHGECRKKT